MCIRTKTSYGCGHEYKTTTECHSSRCQGIDRYHYPKGGDCKPCKEGGHAVTRGREGKGRYAREISRRSQSGEVLTEVSDNVSLDMGGGISPWVPRDVTPSKREKEWHSPSRKKADEAWLQEHVERTSDLQTIRGTASSHSSSDQASTTRGSPTPREARVLEIEEDHHYDREEDYDHNHHRRRESKEKILQVEIKSIHDDHDRRGRRPDYSRRRYDSQESFGSVHSGRSSSGKYKPAPTAYTSYDYYEPRDSGYGSYGSRASHPHEVAKTEPYTYSPTPRTLTLKSPETSYSVYQTGFGVGPVDIVSRAPVYAYSTRRH